MGKVTTTAPNIASFILVKKNSSGPVKTSSIFWGAAAMWCTPVTARTRSKLP